MPNIMKERGDTCGEAIISPNPIALAETIEYAGYEMERAETMSEARMFCSLISVETQTELLDST